MNENNNSSIPRRPHLTKGQRLPNCYKEVEKIVKSVKSCQSNFKTALASSRLRGSQFKKVYKLSLNVLKYYNYIQKIIDKAEILVKEKFLRKEIASVLIYELIFGNGYLPGESKAVTTVQAYQNELMNIHQELQSHNTDITDFNEIYIPRYVRVHTLVTTVPYVIKDLENYGFKQTYYDENISEEMFFQQIKDLEKGNFLVDFHFKDILVFAQDENLIGLDLYKNGHIFLQDKASYIPVHVLNPESGSTVLDACAAPGMKAAHIASKMKNKGVLIACERDESRFETLKETMKYGAVKISKTLCTDFKLIDPDDEAYSAVEYILLDPSCSGSGMVHRMDKVTDTEDSKTKDRLTKLAGFQIILLKHALKFPSVKRVVYSTCSLHEEENEYVVHEALNAFDGTFQLVPVIPEWFDRGSENYEFGKMCLRTVPEKHLTNGFFVAMFERIDTHEHRRKNLSTNNKTNVRRSGNASLEEVDLTHLKLETDDNYQSLKQYEKFRNSGPLEKLHKTSESTKNHDQNVDGMTYWSSTKKSQELIAPELTKHKKREKKYITDIQSDKQNQKGSVTITSSEVLQKSDNSQVIEKCSKMHKVVNENSNTSPVEKKTKCKRLLSSENTFENFESNSKIFKDDKFKNKKRKKECSTSKSKYTITEGGWDMHHGAGDNQNFYQNSFAEEGKKLKVPEFSKQTYKECAINFQSNELNQKESTATLLESLQKSKNSERISSTLKLSEAVNKSPNLEITGNYEVTVSSYLKHKKKKKRDHSADENVSTYVDNMEQVNKINSLESKPDRMKNSKFTVSCSMTSNYLENKSVEGETVSPEEYTLTVKKNKKHKKHSKNSDMVSKLDNISACHLSESQYNSENYTLVHSAENLDNVAQIEEMLKEQNIADNFSTCKKERKRKKHGDRSSGSNETKNHSPDKNLNCSSTVELNQDSCHVKKKKKSKSDETYDSLKFLSSNTDSIHDINKILPRNEVECAVTPITNDYIKRKKHKKHKKNI